MITRPRLISPKYVYKNHEKTAKPYNLTSTNIISLALSLSLSHKPIQLDIHWIFVYKRFLLLSPAMYFEVHTYYSYVHFPFMK